MPEDFPRLTDGNTRRTSPPDVGYNCVAWAACDTSHWWQPGVYWPVHTSRNHFSVAALEQAFQELGYVECLDESFEAGYEKVAFYGFGSVTTGDAFPAR